MTTAGTDAKGPSPFFAVQADRRFSYCLYAPAARGPLPLVVVVHGTQRMAERYRDAYRGFAEEHGCLVVAPLFPAGADEPGDLSGYKRLEFRGTRYDLVLLAMLDEIALRYPVRTDRFHLHGFSGGGQFAHRFALLHPERLASVSVGAPGRITRIDPGTPWWLGTADVEERFGRRLDLPTLRTVPVQMVVGDRDLDTTEIAEPGIDAGGATRIDRLRSLRANFERHGIGVDLVLLPGIGHRGLEVQPAVQRFLAARLGAG
ncbi:alpha/beta hydrolase [Pseudonocardia halophobica]|uniref:alpha/beta hydrolase n=1 Tax=Pseudonocardia halophobica TaxID=29401 RepID=UPI003D8B129D